MVSPSKKRKDRKGRENDDKIVGFGKDKHSGSRKASKPFKPLLSKKFYLDIKNNTSLLKLENKLKSLGATIEQFLVKEVNYVVTDRKETQSPDDRASCSTPILSPSPSPSPSLGVSSPLDGLGQKKTKSRAEAMLERVRLQPQTVNVDPLDNARSWNIPIYSLQQVFERLEKICTKAGHLGKNIPGLKVLRGNYLKLETGRRPDFKQLREWPTIKLNSRRGESAFAPCHDGSQRMTRKLSKDGTERLAAGYCEMCCVDYPDVKAHILTPQHVKFANDPDYYAQLDNVIKSKTVNAFISSQMCASVNAAANSSVANPGRCLRSGSVEGQAHTMGSRSSSLTQSNGHILPRTRASTRSLDDSCTKKPLEVQCNGIVSVNHNHLTRAAVRSENGLGKEFGLECEGISRRTRTISASCVASSNEYSQLSPTGSDITHHLRSRKQMWLPTSLLGTTAEDALNSSRLRTSRDYPMCEAKKSPPQGKGPLRSPVTPVAEELSEKKMKGSDKAEEDKLNSKSLEIEPNRSQESSEDEEEDVEKTSEKNSKSSDSSKSRDQTDDKKAGIKKKLKRKGVSRELANLSYESRRKVQKKRLSVEEKLIEDNKTYYKVEVLNSKLRSTGYYISQSQRELELSKANGNDGCVTQNCTEPIKSEVKIEEKEPVVVRFKKVRQTELSLLSDEAESFMFGEPSRRESSVSTESSSEDDEVSLKLESEENDRIVTKIKKEVIDESSIGSCSITSSSTSSRRKRKSPDDNTQDNVDYYKLETTGTRLRFHGGLFPSTSTIDSKKSLDGSVNESKTDIKNGNSLKVKLDESDFEPENIIDEKKPSTTSKFSYEDLEFSFENIPTHEAWYQTFKRQDECREIYYPTYTNYPKVLLPYEYPNSIIRQIKMEALKQKHKKRKRCTKEQKIQQLIADDKPRKSPRCHASTLAIMSSLMKRRPRDSPEKKSEQPNEMSMVSSDLCIQDEESRCSTIIEPPSVAPSDSQMSATQNSFQGIPEIRIDGKVDNIEDCKKEEDNIKKAAADIEQLFADVCAENDDDVLAHMLQAIKKEVESPPPSNKKGKSKTKSSTKRETVEFENVVTCLPVDPFVLDDDLVENTFTPGPIVNMMSLIDSYRSCTSMERADYEHTNPHAVDALRVLIAESCNSSDCGGSSACDYSFLDDGKVCRKRKRKKRNMTGWPANNKRKGARKSEELSTVVLKRNSKIRDGLVDMESIRECPSDVPSEDTGVSETDVKPDKERCATPVQQTVDSKDSKAADVKSDTVKSDIVKGDLVKSDSKMCSAISRTTSVDSSSIKSFDVQSCYIRVNKMSDVETYTRQLRSSDSSPTTPKSSRRGSTRQAKTMGRESLRRCR